MAKVSKKLASRSKELVAARQSAGIATLSALPVLNLPDALAGYTVARAVTMRNMKFPKEACIYVKFVSTMYQAAKRKGGKPAGDGKVMDPPTLAQVIDLAAGTGEVVTLVIPAVLRGELGEKYPGDGVQDDNGDWTTPPDGFVNRAFAIQSFPRTDTQAYRTFAIAELVEKA